MDWNSDALLALYGTVFGGVGLKLIEAWLGRGPRRDTTATQFREELRGELNNLRAEAAKLRAEAATVDKDVDAWRAKYFSLLSAVARNDYDEMKKHLGK